MVAARTWRSGGWGLVGLVGVACSAYAGSGAVPNDAGETNIDDGGATAEAGADAQFAADGGVVEAGVPRRAFVTSATFLGGQLGVEPTTWDLRCSSVAPPSATGFVAFLSKNGLNARDRLDPGVPWVRLDGVRIAPSLSALSSGVLEAPLDLDESGTRVTSTTVWTGSLSAAIASGADCNGWTSSTTSAFGRVGKASEIEAPWISSSDATCTQRAHVYCFEK